jgi:hypothetical protein
MLVHLGAYGFVEIVIFVSILVVGLIYAWMEVALTWVSGNYSQYFSSLPVISGAPVPFVYAERLWVDNVATRAGEP